ncbi:MAG: phosphogluconate dehydrogenase (NAD(+)-dependent, decarboxylating), partial [Bacteroidota bacterium]
RLRQKASEAGVATASSIPAVVSGLPERKILWLMVPAGDPVEAVILQLSESLQLGDIVIDGGNSNYKQTLRRYEMLREKGIHFIDCGTSGGISGALNGACLMVGGDREAVEFCEPFFKAIALPGGYLHVGEAGSGHFVKMVHNGIEYGMMQAIAEGFELLKKSPFSVDYQKVAGMWNHGSVIRGWLMELTESAFSKDADLSQIKGVMHSSGEGKWSVETALDFQVPAPVIALSLMMRYRSLEENTFAGKVVAALRNEFGGHAVER